MDDPASDPDPVPYTHGHKHLETVQWRHLWGLAVLDAYQVPGTRYLTLILQTSTYKLGGRGDAQDHHPHYTDEESETVRS